MFSGNEGISEEDNGWINSQLLSLPMVRVPGHRIQTSDKNICISHNQGEIVASKNHDVFESENRFSPSIGEHLYLNEKRADFHFVLESSESICERLPVHKLLLSTSDFFETMFSGTWNETNEAAIGDTTAAVFKEFLQFFYLSRVKLTKTNVGDVMKLGHMYNVPECVNVCAMFMMSLLTDENVCWAYEYAVLYDHEELKKYCEIVIGIHTKAVIKSKSFLECDRTILSRILKMDSLHCPEIELFEACLAWIKSAGKQDQLTKNIVNEHRGDLLYDIRFGLMSSQEFATVHSACFIFSIAEYKEILQMFGSKEFKPKIFNENGKARYENFKCNGSDDLNTNYLRAISMYRTEMPYFIKEVETTAFTTNKPIMLRGLVFEMSSSFDETESRYKYLDEDLHSEFEIVEIRGSEHFGEEQIIYSEKFILKTTKDLIFKSFDHAILIRPRFTYEIRMKQSPPKDCCTGFLLKSELKLGSGVIIKFNRSPIDEENEDVLRGPIIGMNFIPF